MANDMLEISDGFSLVWVLIHLLCILYIYISKVFYISVVFSIICIVYCEMKTNKLETWNLICRYSTLLQVSLNFELKKMNIIILLLLLTFILPCRFCEKTNKQTNKQTKQNKQTNKKTCKSICRGCFFLCVSYFVNFQKIPRRVVKGSQYGEQNMSWNVLLISIYSYWNYKVPCQNTALWS